MDFMDRSARQTQPAQSATSDSPNQTTSGHRGNRGGKFSDIQGMRILSVALMFAVTVLLIALASSLFFGKGVSESRYVDGSKMQAVFLNGGQVYFGKISSLNSQYVRVADIYYLRVNQQVQPGQNTATNDISLVKLGCELHGPTDSMVINREQVIFWENLKDDGQVAKAVADYKKANPNGQQCAQPQANTDTTKTDTPKKP